MFKKYIHYFSKKLVFLFSIFFASCMCGAQTYEEKLKSLYNYTVPLIQPKDLNKNISENPNIVILDTRSLEEFNVSHILNSQFIDYDAFNKTKVGHISKNSKIVVYCSVGYRSEKVGEKLLKWGFTDVQNLYGGIFEWKMQGFDVVDNDKKITEKVHTYDENWGKWLTKGEKVY